MKRNSVSYFVHAMVFVTLAEATAETLSVEAFHGFLAPLSMGFRSRKAVVELSWVVALAIDTHVHV